MSRTVNERKRICILASPKIGITHGLHPGLVDHDRLFILIRQAVLNLGIVHHICQSITIYSYISCIIGQRELSVLVRIIPFIIASNIRNTEFYVSLLYEEILNIYKADSTPSGNIEIAVIKTAEGIAGRHAGHSVCHIEI